MASTRYHGDLYAKTALDRACGLWVRVGSWNDAHHVFVSCDRRVAFGTVLELEDAHPWSGSSGRRHASFTEWLTARRPSEEAMDADTMDAILAARPWPGSDD